MKRFLIVLLVIVLAASLMVGCAQKTQEQPADQEKQQEQQAEKKDELKVGMVTDIGGLGDQSFNDAAWRGLKMAEEKLGAKVTVVESNKMEDYVPNLSSLPQQGYDLTWAIGFLMTNALEEVAPQFPDKKFGIIDSVVDAPNVASATFKEEEGSFLVGVVAGLKTKTNKIGFIGGMEVPLIIKFEQGFIAGVKAVNPDAEVIVSYTGAFDDPQKGKELANTQFSQGADIIYHASGACGIGVIEAAKEKGLYAIGVDSDQRHLAPDNVLCSMVKKVDVAVFDITKKVAEGTFESKHYVYGLKENGVGLAESDRENLDGETLKIVDEYREKIINGEIKVPTER